MSAITKRCPSCRRTLVGRLNTDRCGHVVEEWPTCPCESGAPPLELQPDDLSYEERAAAARKTGICMDCDQQVEGARGRALRCAEHKRRAKLDAANAARRTKRGRKKRRKYERARLKNPEFRERRLARRRELHAERMENDPEYASEYRRRRQRETLASYPGRDAYLAKQAEHNAVAERQEKKREQARQRYYELHPERPDPHCATCGERIDWTPGRGRPPKYHQTPDCNPRWAIRDTDLKETARGERSLDREVEGALRHRVAADADAARQG